MNRKSHFIFLFLICFYINNIEAVVVISFGGCCTVATVLRELGLRKSAYPFDWMLSIEFNGVYEAIKDDFQKFLDPATLKISNAKRTVENKYGCEFVHDFPTIYHSAALTDADTHEWNEIRADWRDFIEPIHQKYARRIERLKNALSGSDHVVLIRYSTLATDRDTFIKLRNLLIERYPNLSFTILAVCSVPEQFVEWNLERIKNFSVPYATSEFWPGWKRIFNLLGINQNTVRYVEEEYDDKDDCICNEACHHNWALKRKD